MDELEIRVCGIGLLLSRADAVLVARRLAEAGIGEEALAPGRRRPILSPRKPVQPHGTAKAVPPEPGRPVSDDDPLWSMHSGEAKRYEGPEWRPGDEPLARILQDRLTRYTAAFHHTLVDHPGRLLSVEDLGNLTDGLLSSNRVIAGAVAGYANWCESIGRRFPFCWWGGRNGGSATYAMQTRVAKLFRGARD